MLNLDAYSVRDLQTCAGVIASALEVGLPTEQIGVVLRAAIAGRRSVPVELGDRPAVTGAVVPLPVCPQCGRGQMLLGKPYEGLIRIGCPYCRYSQIISPVEGGTKK